MQSALESALAELVFGPEISPSDPAGIAAWLTRNEVRGADAQALTRDFPRLLRYRRLARGNLKQALRDTLPRTLFRLGTVFEPYFAEFLRVAPPLSHCLKDLAPSFLTFIAPRLLADERVPAYLLNLAEHEALQIEIASLPDQPRPELEGELSLDAGVEFIAQARLVRYQWAVHLLPEAEDSLELPPAVPVSLLVYRSPEHEVRYLELGSFAAHLLSGLLVERRSLRSSLEKAAEIEGQALDDALLSRAARLLAELGERGALLGKSPIEGPSPAMGCPTPPNQPKLSRFESPP